MEAGFQPDFPDEVAREVQALNQGAPKNAAPAARDLRSLLWSSIDNDSSRDLDQVEYVDKLPDGTVRLLVGIADVDASVLKGSATDRHAAAGPYSESELSAIAAHCTERDDAARKVERLMRKVAAACLLSRRIGEVFDGIITGASPKGTYVRLLKFPAEGMVVRGARGIDVGDTVRVRLASVNVAKGFIDFERK